MTGPARDRYRAKHLRPTDDASSDVGFRAGPDSAAHVAGDAPTDVSVRRVIVQTGPARRAAFGAGRHAGHLAKATGATLKRKLSPPKAPVAVAPNPTLRVQPDRAHGRAPVPNPIRQMWNPLREVQSPEQLVMLQRRSMRALPRLLWLPLLIAVVAVLFAVAAWGMFVPVVVAAFALLVGAAIVAGVKHLGWMVSYYLVTTDRVFFIEGALRRKVVSVPLGAISQVNFEQSVWELPYDWGKIQIRAPNQDPRTEQLRYVQHAPEFYRALNRMILTRSHPAAKQTKVWPPIPLPGMVPAAQPHPAPHRVSAFDTAETPIVTHAPTWRPPAPQAVRDDTAEFAPIEAERTDA